MVSARDATATITIGKSTKADVLNSLGKTTAFTFDSGYEIWVYHLAGDARGADNRGRPDSGKAEYVVLFSPAGVVTKTRIRPPPLT